MRKLLWVMVWLALSCGMAWAAGQAPAGYVVAISLKGQDLAQKTAIVRQGKELEPRLMMPVFEGDAIFLRDMQSRITVELGNGQTVDVGGGTPRYEVKGEIDTGDDTWSIIAAVGAILGSSGSDAGIAPDTMAAKGIGITVPMAVHNANYLVRGSRGIWLAWQGGTAPYSVSLGAEGAENLHQDSINVPEITFSMPADSPERFAVIIRDANGGSAVVRFRVAEALPDLPGDVAARRDSPAKHLAAAAWLTGVKDGAWSVEAAQALKAKADSEPAAAALLGQIEAGWRLK